MQLKVAVRTLADKLLFLDANENDSVEKFQAMLQERQGTPIGDQVLLLKDSRMTPGRLLGHYNLSTKDEVLLYRKLPERPPWSPEPPTRNAVQCAALAKYNRQAMQAALPALPSFPPPKVEAEQRPDPLPDNRTQVPLLLPGVLVRPPPQAISAVPEVTVLVAQVSPLHATGQTTPRAATIGWPSPEVTKKPREDVAKRGNTAKPLPQVPIDRAAPVGVPRSAPAGTHSQPCTPRTPATPHPVASWAPPIIAPAATPTVPQVSPGSSHRDPSTPGSSRLHNPATKKAPSAGAHPTVVSIRPPPASARIRRADLERVGRLGVGAFGVVTLEMDRRTGRTYALKAVSKGYLAQLHMEHSVLNEKRILKMVETPFIVRLLATYNGREHVYFLLEAALGGELFTIYERHRFYGSEDHARFYVGCCVEAIAHLHERHVIYRDLKPENLLLDTRGYCKLTDMGLAKVTQSQTYTLVGTPDYMAPEVINCTGHNKSVDWWMLGVLLFELLAGRPPFDSETTEKIYEGVRKGIDAVVFPPEVRKAESLVKAFCRNDPEARIRAVETRADPWFRTLDWPSLRACRIPAPHIPKVKGVRDLGNFRSCDQEDPPRVPYKDKGTGWDNGFEDDIPNPTVAASVGALPGAIPTEPVDASAGAAVLAAPDSRHKATGGLGGSVSADAPLSARGTLASKIGAPLKVSPPQGTRVPAWAWTPASVPATGLSAGSWNPPPTLHMTGCHSAKSLREINVKAGAPVWSQREAPTSPRVPGCGGG